MAKTKRRWAFGAVSTGLQIGHATVAAATIGFGLLVLVQVSPARLDLSAGRNIALVAVIAGLCLHGLLMLATPVWAWLAARTQTQVSRLWAWLGYLVPLASYWLPAQTLRGLVGSADTDGARLRTQILLWGVARGLAAPSAFVAVGYAVYKSGLTGLPAGWVVVGYMIVTIAAANLLSLLTIGQMHRHLAANAVEARHAEVFS